MVNAAVSPKVDSTVDPVITSTTGAKNLNSDFNTNLDQTSNILTENQPIVYDRALFFEWENAQWQTRTQSILYNINSNKPTRGKLVSFSDIIPPHTEYINSSEFQSINAIDKLTYGKSLQNYTATNSETKVEKVSFRNFNKSDGSSEISEVFDNNTLDKNFEKNLIKNNKRFHKNKKVEETPQDYARKQDVSDNLGKNSEECISNRDVAELMDKSSWRSTKKVEHVVDNNPSDSFLEKKENHQSSVRECSEADELVENVDTYIHAWGKKAPKMQKVEEDPEVYKRYKPKTTSSSTKLEEVPLDPLSNKEIKEIIGRPATGYNSMDDTDAHMYKLNMQDVPPRSYTMELIKTHGGYYKDEWGAENLEQVPKDYVYNWSLGEGTRDIPNKYHGADTSNMAPGDYVYDWGDNDGIKTPDGYKPRQRGETNNIIDNPGQQYNNNTMNNQFTYDQEQEYSSAPDNSTENDYGYSDPEEYREDSNLTSYQDSFEYDDKLAEFASWRYPRSNADGYIRNYNTIEESVDQKDLPSLRGYRPDNDADYSNWEYFPRIARYLGNNITGDRAAYNEFWNVINYIDPLNQAYCPPLAIILAIIVAACREFGGNRLILISHPTHFVLGLYSHSTRSMIIYKPLISIENTVWGFRTIEHTTKAALKFINGGEAPIYDTCLHNNDELKYKYDAYNGCKQTQPTECRIKKKNLPNSIKPSILKKKKPIKRIRPTLRRMALARYNSLRIRPQTGISQRVNSVYFIYRNRLRNPATLRKVRKMLKTNQTRFFS